MRTAGNSIRRLDQSLEPDDVDAGLDDDPEVVAESPDDDVFSDDFGDASPSLPVSDPLSPSFDADALLFAAASRSFLAQPDPLKWIAGGANAFRTGPDPHSGHCSGDGSLRPWITSNRRPHAAQS